MPIRNIIGLDGKMGSGEFLGNIYKDSNEVKGALMRAFILEVTGDRGRVEALNNSLAGLREMEGELWRGYVKNRSGHDVYVKMDGTVFRIRDGRTYLCHRQELLLILEKGPELEVGTAADFINDYVSGNEAGFVS